jgi:hypothetical protein
LTTGPGTAYWAVKVAVLVAGMLTGADSIEDTDVLRYGAIAKISTDLRPVHVADVHPWLHPPTRRGEPLPVRLR